MEEIARMEELGKTPNVPKRTAIRRVGFVAAALIAARICPAARDFMLASHVSREPAGARVLAELGLSAIVHGDMALGEGTGAVTLFPLMDMALAVYAGPHTFDSMGMQAYAPQGGTI